MAGELITTVFGNLTADPELRYTPSGAAVANFVVAHAPRVYDRDQNKWVEGETMFVRCNVWREFAENFAASCVKGTRVVVHGAMSARAWEDKDGNKRTSWELNVEAGGPDLRFTPVVAQGQGTAQPQGFPSVQEPAMQTQTPHQQNGQPDSAGWGQPQQGGPAPY